MTEQKRLRPKYSKGQRDAREAKFFGEEMAGRNFSPDFHSRQESVMKTPWIRIRERVKAAIFRYSWGNHSPFCVDDRGGELPVGQLWIAKKLGISKQAVSDAIEELEADNEVKRDHRKILPVMQPGTLSAAALEERELKAALRQANPETTEQQYPPGKEADEVARKSKYQLFQQWAHEAMPEFFRSKQETDQLYAELRRQQDEVNRALREATRQREVFEKLLLKQYRLWERSDTQQITKSGTPPTFEVGDVPDKKSAPPPTSHHYCFPKETKETPSSSSSLQGAEQSAATVQPAATTTTTGLDLTAVRNALGKYGPVDQKAVNDLVAAVLKADPGATAEQIAHAIHGKAPKARSNPVGLCLRTVPPLFEGKDSYYRQHRAERSRKAELAVSTDSTEWVTALEAAREVLADPLTPEAEKQHYRETWAEELEGFEVTEELMEQTVRKRVEQLQRHLLDSRVGDITKFAVQQEINDRNLWLSSRRRAS